MPGVGDELRADNANWSFGGDVSEHFDEHVQRSVPFYRAGHELVTHATDFFLPNGSLLYELGCSTGSLLTRLAARHRRKDVRIVGIDREPEMVARAREKCAGHPNVEVIEGDILEVPLENADVIIAYYTVQFVLPRVRQQLIDRIYQSLNWGGAFFLFEKVRGPDARFQDMLNALYTEYKLEQGYQSEEIVAKMRSLKGVLEPFSSEGNLGLLQRAGFTDITTVFKYICFEGFLAIK
ncbi:methyltransferase domain-containing protein [Thioalkalivibrio paradoxus]|uniref:Methyltransferase n=1 Tax=Thioalkalivibrio paradoxus ARh 1 TaxID=713585 RepID=W0DG22_9GAMM|nr:methyltransferase domain-containing protein [Thioalkalivibrio paradoxus]AHE97599.1 methyltransferase [Thioalkalivibrio paradoxus ARh 1]